MEQVPTLDTAGSTASYTIRTYDTTTKMVLERSYATTTSFDAINFSGGQNSIIPSVGVVTV
mgnify:CR=1 FL=1